VNRVSASVEYNALDFIFIYCIYKYTAAKLKSLQKSRCAKLENVIVFQYIFTILKGMFEIKVVDYNDTCMLFTNYLWVEADWENRKDFFEVHCFRCCAVCPKSHATRNLKVNILLV
jgi:hypothetical protein